MTDQMTPGDGQGQQQTQQTQQTPPAGVAWLPGADELTVGYVQNKGWDNPAKAVESYRNLEKLFGADKAGNTVVLPKPDAQPAELDAFYNRLGRPASADGYKIPVPEGSDPAFSKVAAQWFFENGVPAKAAEGIATKWNEFAKQQAELADQTRVEKFTVEDQALRKKWGAAFDQNLGQVKSFYQAAGLDETVIDALQESMGHLRTMEFLHSLAIKTGEPEFVNGQTQPGFGGAMTPEQAKARVEDLKADPTWRAKYLNGDVTAKDEMARLMRFAYPEQR